MIRTLAALLATALVGCAYEYGSPTFYYQHGVERPAAEYYRAKAECERKVGGANYPENFNLCMREAGWKIGYKPGFYHHTELR